MMIAAAMRSWPSDEIPRSGHPFAGLLTACSVVILVSMWMGIVSILLVLLAGSTGNQCCVFLTHLITQSNSNIIIPLLQRDYMRND